MKKFNHGAGTSCSPNFFCNWQLKVTLQTVRLYTFNRKILENSPASRALPQSPLYTAYAFFKKYILHKVILWIWLSWLFFTSFCSPNRKVVPAPTSYGSVSDHFGPSAFNKFEFYDSREIESSWTYAHAVESVVVSVTSDNTFRLISTTWSITRLSMTVSHPVHAINAYMYIINTR